MSPKSNDTFELVFSTFFLATSIALGLISLAYTGKLSSFESAIAIAPVPVPTSIIEGLLSLLAYFMTYSTNSSVSLLGIKTFLLTSSVYP